jgi:hypothetical protein
MTESEQRYPELTAKQRLQLMRVEPSRYYRLEYRPCRVKLRDGSALDRVYVVQAAPYYDVWGVWPEEDEGKHALDIRKVVEIEDSPQRMPVKFANELYGAKETRAGVHIFILEWPDEFKQPYMTGSAVDFVPAPEGRKLKDALIVHPHKGKRDPNIVKGLSYYWCLYEE